MANNLDLQQIIQQVMGNQDLLGQLQGMSAKDTSGVKNAVRGAGIPISGDQIAGLMSAVSGIAGSVDVGSVMKNVDLSDGIDMKDVQGIAGSLFGGGKR